MDKEYKQCPVCKTTDYPKAESKGHLCKPCANKRATKWNKENPDKLRNRSIKKKYGLSFEKYQEMFLSQNGKCKICHCPETDVDKRNLTLKFLAVDHCHTTGKVRGLLCRKCNIALGIINENTETLKNMINYIKESYVN